MRLYRHFDDIVSRDKGCVVALGNFDGFHQGHQVVIGEAGRMARTMGLNLAVVVTEPHPINFFKPDAAPFRLTPFRQRTQLLEEFGVDVLLVLPFDKTLASMSAQSFVEDCLVQGLGAKHVCVGYDYRFGAKRGGGLDVLKWMGEMEGFTVGVIPPVTVSAIAQDPQVYSSTLIRDALKEGCPRKAAELLGHWWAVYGRVTKGDQRGRTIGFPTANIELGESMPPKKGVYAVRVLLDEEDSDKVVYTGVANFGERPTFDKRDMLLEVHIFDFNQDIYERHLRVEFVDFIRPEVTFDSLHSLKKQIEKDCVAAKTLLNKPENSRECFKTPSLDGYLQQFPTSYDR